MRLRILLAAALAAGCADHASAPPAPGFPATVAGFERSTDPQPARNGTVTGYEFTQSGPILATVDVRPPSGTSLLPSLDTRRDADAGQSAALLSRAKAQVARYYPAGRVTDEGQAFVLLNGRLQPGSHARIVFDDIFAGREQPIALDITTVCCDATGRSYEYRFRFPASLQDEQPIAEFKRLFKLN